MRSPGDISLLEIKVPPAKIVPSTMPVLTTQRRHCRRCCGTEHQSARCCVRSSSYSYVIHSQFRAMLDSPWKTAMPEPRFSFISHDLSTSYEYNLETEKQTISDIRGSIPCTSTTPPLTGAPAPPSQKPSPSARCRAPRLPPLLLWTPEKNQTAETRPQVQLNS